MSTEPSALRKLSRRAKWLIAVVTLGAVWLVSCTVLLVFPDTQRPQKSDAILVLGPPGAARLRTALALIDAGVSTNLVISVNSIYQRQANALCLHPPAGVNVFCFHAEPQTTLGEGRSLAKLVTEHGWRSINVVTSKYHLSRADFILNHCSDVKLAMVASSEKIGLGQWAYQYLYQSAGFAKALVQFKC